MARSQQNVVARSRRQWNLLVRSCGFLVVVIGTFWVLPAGDLFDRKMMQHFAQFIIAAVTGIMVLPMMKWCCTIRHAWLWARTAGIAVAAGALLFFLFEDLKGDWTVVQRGRTIYIGTEIRPEVQEFVLKNPTLSKADLLEFAAWDPKKIWTERSLARCRMRLMILYIASIPFFVVAILSVAQVMYCAGRRRGAARPSGKTAQQQSHADS